MVAQKMDHHMDLRGKVCPYPIVETRVFLKKMAPGEVLEEVSAFYAKALRDAIKTVTGMIEPIMIIIMGSIVGFIAMAIILPIFKMSSLVGG